MQPRSVKLDLTALGLLAATLFLAMALVSYHPADPPGTSVFPRHPEPVNACGRWGAWSAHLLLSGLGLGAYYLVASLAVVDAMLLTRRAIREPALRLVGWTLSLVGLAVLVAMAVPGASPGPVIGSGGYLGAAIHGLFEQHFATGGAYVLAASLVLGGLLLCTDYLLLRIGMWLVGAPARQIVRAGQAVARRSPSPPERKSRARRSDLALPRGTDDEPTAHEENEEEEASDAELSVKFGGKGAEASPSAESDDSSADPSASPAGRRGMAGVKKRLARALGIDGSQTSAEAVGNAPHAAPPDDDAQTGGPRVRPPVRKKSEREEVIDQLEAASRADEPPRNYALPPVELLSPSDDFPFEAHEKAVRRTAKLLEKTFADFGYRVRVVEILTGPVIAQYEIELEKGLRLSKITNLADDIAIALRVPSVRIVAPIPGKNTVGIEVPNAERQLVRMRELIEESRPQVSKLKIPIFLGRDVAGNPMVIDLASLPHLLIAGRTGTGKSVCLNSIIVSMLMTRRPDEVRMLLIDPKMVELSPYQRLPHLMHPVVTDMRKAAAILEWAVEKMEERYALLARAGVRHVSLYNQLDEEELMERLGPESPEEREQIPRHLPYIVIVADEMADLMMTAGKEVEQHIIRLAQKSRAVGIHLILATQKPTVDVITGLIKSNLPARIAFQVASRTDSRVVLDEMGADRLLGNGDMLLLWPGTSTLHRGQGTYVSDEEINSILNVVGTSQPQFVKELVQLKPKEEPAAAGQLAHRDDLYESAVEIVIGEGRGSVSLLQRALGIGYGRAARLIDFMAEDGIVGTYNGSQAREVLITVDDWEQMRSRPAAPPQPAPSRRASAIQPLPPPSGRKAASADPFENEEAPWLGSAADEDQPYQDDEQYDADEGDDDEGDADEDDADAYDQYDGGEDEEDGEDERDGHNGFESGGHVDDEEPDDDAPVEEMGEDEEDDTDDEEDEPEDAADRPVTRPMSRRIRPHRRSGTR